MPTKFYKLKLEKQKKAEALNRLNTKKERIERILSHK